MFSIDHFSKHLSQLTQNKKFLIAYSGGLDSHVLLHTLYQHQKKHPEIQLRAIHIHHGLSPFADEWQMHCEAVCVELGINCLLRKINIKSGSLSLEEAARVARYAVFKELIQADECLLTAHTLDDQAETLLLQLLRGAGIKGMSAMPDKISFACGLFIRPLLIFSRNELMQYAHEQGLQWIEDESNMNLRFDRNYLRRQIIPSLQNRWPAVNKVVSRVAAHCAESSALLDELAMLDFQRAKGPCENTLCIDILTALNAPRQRNLIRYWLRTLNFPMPSDIKLKQLQHDFLYCRKCANPLIQWQNVEIRRYQNHLYAMGSLPAHDPQIIIPWNLKAPLNLPNDLGVLLPEHITHRAWLLNQSEKVTVRFRQGGERCGLQGRQGTRVLKKLLQEWHMPPWLRDRVPLIYCGEKLIEITPIRV